MSSSQEKSQEKEDKNILIKYYQFELNTSMSSRQLTGIPVSSSQARVIHILTTTEYWKV